MSSNDILYDCAVAYKQLCNYEYNVLATVNKEIIDITLRFEESNFKHLLGIDKLKDKNTYRGMSSSDFLNNILNHTIELSDLQSSTHFNDKLNMEQSSVCYTIYNRIEKLNELYNTLHSEIPNMYKWNANCRPNERPFGSKIPAEFLFTFNSNNKNIPTEKICLFFGNDKTNNNDLSHVNPMSIIPSDVPYNTDGRRTVPEVTILKMVEIDKTRKITTELITSPQEDINKAIQEADEKKNGKKIKETLKSIKNRRKTYFQNPNDTTLKAYKNTLNALQNDYFTKEMLISINESLSTQFEDPHNSNVKKLIANEIDFISKEIKCREIGINDGKPTFSFSITMEQGDTGGIKSIKKIITVPIPNKVAKTVQAAERKSDYIGSTISAVMSDISITIIKAVKSITAAFSPKPQHKSKENTKSPKPTKTSETKTTEQPTKQPSTEKKHYYSVDDLSKPQYTPRTTKQEHNRETIKRKNDVDL